MRILPLILILFLGCVKTPEKPRLRTNEPKEKIHRIFLNALYTSEIKDYVNYSIIIDGLEIEKVKTSLDEEVFTVKKEVGDVLIKQNIRYYSLPSRTVIQVTCSHGVYYIHPNMYVWNDLQDSQHFKTEFSFRNLIDNTYHEIPYKEYTYKIYGSRAHLKYYNDAKNKRGLTKIDDSYTIVCDDPKYNNMLKELHDLKEEAVKNVEEYIEQNL